MFKPLLLQNKFVLGRLEAQHIQIVLAKVEILYVLQQLFTTCNLICCKTGLIRRWNNLQHRYWTHFAAMLQNKLLFFCRPFYRNSSYSGFPIFQNSVEKSIFV